MSIDDQLEAGDLLHRQVRRFLAVENPAGVDAGLTRPLGDAAAIANQAAGGSKFAIGRDRGHRVRDRKRRDVLVAAVEERVGADDERSGPFSRSIAKAASSSRSVLADDEFEVQPQRAGRGRKVPRLGFGKNRISCGSRGARKLPAVGTTARSSSSCYAPTFAPNVVTP